MATAQPRWESPGPSLEDKWSTCPKSGSDPAFSQDVESPDVALSFACTQSAAPADIMMSSKHALETTKRNFTAAPLIDTVRTLPTRFAIRDGKERRARPRLRESRAE